MGHPVLSSSRFDMCDGGQLPLFRIMPFGAYIRYLSGKGTGVSLGSYYWTRTIVSSTDYAFISPYTYQWNTAEVGYTSASSSSVSLMVRAHLLSYAD